MLKHHKAA